MFQVYSTVIHLYIYIDILCPYMPILQVLFPYRLLPNTGQSSLCYTVDPCWLSVLCIAACLYYTQSQKTVLSFFQNHWGPLQFLSIAHVPAVMDLRIQPPVGMCFREIFAKFMLLELMLFITHFGFYAWNEGADGEGRRGRSSDRGLKNQ